MKNWDAENQKIVNCWHIPWVKNILRHTHLPNQLNGQNLIGMPVLFPQFGMNPFLFINTRSPGRCWIYPFWGPRIIVWGWDIQSNWFGSTPTLGFGAAVASGIQGYHSRSSTCCQKSHPSKVILEDLEVRAPPFSHLHNWWLPHKDQPGFSEAKLSWGGISSYPNVWEVQCSMIVFLVFINLYISKFYQLIYRSFWPFYIFYPYFGTSKTPLNTFMLRLEVVRNCVNQIDKTDCVKHQSNLQKLCRVSEPCKLLRPFAGQNLQVSTRDLGLPRASTLSQMAKIITPKHKIHKIHKIPNLQKNGVGSLLTTDLCFKQLPTHWGHLAAPVSSEKLEEAVTVT